MCDSACAQIVSKEYVKAFTKEYNMLAYGIAFAKKKAYIKEVHRVVNNLVTWYDF